MADQAKETEGTPPEKHHLRDGSMKSEVENAILSGKAEGLEPGRETYASIMATNKPNPRGPGYIKLLVAQDRYEEARGIIAKYHTNGDLNHPLVALQMKEMIGSLEETHLASWKDLFDLKVLVETRSARYRLMLNIAFSWFGQFSGNNIASYYLPLMLNNVGVTDTDTKLILNIVYAVIGWVFSATGSRLHDIVGRRKMLMATTAGMAICLALVAACAAGFVEYGNTTASTVSIVFIFMFGAVFSIGYTPMQPIYPAEVVSNKMRAKAMGTFKLTAGAAGFLNTFVGPIALSNIGYWFYVFFVFWDTFELGFMYFFFVETKGMTLEELDAIFEAKNPRKASVAAKKTQNRILKGGIAGV
ncbi:hypothetical protein FQN51_004430 [Onygenales sp. PD_10]|nr:hypothetical protein FQN51_004430 [Onygenales sp. PD_10]